MAHKEQQEFCRDVSNKFVMYFNKANVIDVGSMDINGNNRELWDDVPFNCYYGIDLATGPNVDLIGPAHEVLATIESFLKKEFYQKNGTFTLKKRYWPVDVMISTNALEHDRYWHETLTAMYNALRPGGLMVISAGGDGRGEHGTHRACPECSPHTLDYYRNLSNAMFGDALHPALFEYYQLGQDHREKDLQFVGIKKT